MRAELVRVVGKAGALQPDMHRRRHRAARPRFAVVPDPALRLVEAAFVKLLVTRHIGSLPGSHPMARHHTVAPRRLRWAIWSGAGWAIWRDRKSVVEGKRVDLGG